MAYNKKIFLCVFLSCFFLWTHTHAETIEYDLEISLEDVNISGKPVLAMTINGTIPGPTLHFKEGDAAIIHVHNKMDVDTLNTLARHTCTP